MAFLLLGALVLAGVGAQVLDREPTSAPPAATPVALRPITPVVSALALSGAPTDLVRELPARATGRFSLLGVTWDDPRSLVDGELRVRARSAADGRWGRWHRLDNDSDAGDGTGTGTGARGGTEAVWVGDSDAVQVSVHGETGARLPEGMRLDLVDPGRAPAGDAADAERVAFAVPRAEGADPVPQATDADGPAETGAVTPAQDEEPAPATSGTATSTTTTTTTIVTGSGPTTSATTTVATTPTTTSSTTPVSPVNAPTLVTRTGWRADETLRKDPPELADHLGVVFVHHTATTNDYDCADSPAIVRSLYAYHVKSLGWNDLGYNFVVDKCGTLFEGRAGGVDQPVIGAHTLGFNTASTGISVIGTYTSTGAPAAARATVAHVAAWKLGAYGISPFGSSTLVAGVSKPGYTQGSSYSFAAVSGHRDAHATECPGAAFHAQLPGIRTWATRPAAATVSVTGGATTVGSTAYTRGTPTLSWAITSPGRLVKDYQVLVDGTVTATTTTRSATLALVPGAHRVSVRTRHMAGTTA
ncbi:MAG: peptidoglycan recognition protein, partial [Actinomycetales bacterium]|nr:peptidoglycan recognition protein [Actinomycetales bacterium]